MIDLARVVAVYPESHTVDLVFLADGRTMTEVRTMSALASTNTGTVDMPIPTPSVGDIATAPMSEDRDMIAVVAYYGGIPVVLGYLFPHISEMMFPDAERMVYRHASDFYITIDKDGNTELAHPGGAFVRIGTSSAHEDLTGTDFDGLWQIRRNTGQAAHIHIEQAGGVASVNIAPNGDTVVMAPTVTIDSPTTTCTGTLTVEGLLTYQDGLVGFAGSQSSTATITGNISVDGNVTATGTVTDSGGNTNHHSH